MRATDQSQAEDCAIRAAIVLQSLAMPALSDYYQRELAYYRELLSEFSREHGEVAHLVDGRQADTAVERLLQGAALVTGHLRSRVEDAFSELAQPLCGREWPRRLRATPAIVALDARPESRAVRKVLQLPRGAPIRLALADAEEQPGDSPSAVPARDYEFCNCTPLELAPIELQEVHISRVGPADTRLRLRFAFGGGAGFKAAGLRRLRLHFVGRPETRYQLYLLLCRELVRVVLEDAGGESVLLMGPEDVRPIGFSPQEMLLPDGPVPRPGLQYLFEYFDLAAKFLGVDVTGLDRLPPTAPGDAFALTFYLGEQPDLPLLGLEDFGLARLFALNLSGPTRIAVGGGGGGEAPIHLRDGEREVYSLEAVARQVEGGSQLLAEAGHDVHVHGSQAPSYEMGLSADVIGDVRPQLRIIDTKGEPAPRIRGLDVRARLWDRALAAAPTVHSALQRPCRAGVFKLHLAGTLVSPRILSSSQLDGLWEALAQLRMRPSDLCSVNGLGHLVREARRGREGAGPEPEILDVRWRLASQVYRRTVVAVREVEVDLADESFVSAGQLFLFGRVLSELFRREGDSPTYWALTVRGVPAGGCYRFGPQ